MSLVAYGDSSDSEEEARNGVHRKPRGSEKGQNMRQLLSVLPAACRKGKKQPVRLVVPSLTPHPGPGTKSDPDSDDDGPSAKRSNNGGLTAILPRPKQASKIVGKGQGTPQIMVPYTLTRPPTAAKRKRKGLPSKSVKSSNVGEDSDSDGAEPVSFFSHLESTSPDRIHVSDSSSGIRPAGGYGHHGGCDTVCPVSEVANTAPNVPKPFYVGKEAGEELYPGPDPLLLLGGWGLPEGSRDERFSDPAESNPSSQGEVPGAGLGPGLSVSDPALQRLTGRMKRGRDPALNDLIEITEDEVKVGIEMYRKHNSEEVVNKLYQPPEGKPTGQQKKKHQLTYLAHEAKANELKLLKQWGQSAATRRDTQMKYGF